MHAQNDEPTLWLKMVATHKIYIALLRGINVGGKNIIKMSDLKACFEDMGFESVATYIQSGNILFDSNHLERESMEDKIRNGLFQNFNYNGTIVLISSDELQQVITNAPDGFGADYDQNKYDVLYLKKPLTAREALIDIPVKEDVDDAFAGPGVVYYRRTADHLSKSRLNKLPSLPIYQKITIRNWKTSNKILEMVGGVGK